MPFQRALTGPTLTVATAWNSLSRIMSSCSQPGMQPFSTSGSLSFAHTISRLRGQLDLAVHGHRHRRSPWSRRAGLGAVSAQTLGLRAWTWRRRKELSRAWPRAGRAAGGWRAARGRLMAVRASPCIADDQPAAPSSLLTPLISSAAMRAIVDDRARLQRMLDFEVALARAQAALGVIPALATDPIADAASAERYDINALGEEAVAAGNVAIPLIKALTAEVAKTDADGRRLRALGRDQPGRHRHRAGAGAARGDRRAGGRPQPRDRGVRHARRPPSPHRRGRPHLAAARAADAVRAQARGLCGGARALARAAAAVAQGGAGAAVRRRRRHARGARRPRPRGRRAARGAARPAAARRALAQPPRPAGGGRVRASRSSPAPAARSRATSRC